jgi:hypothetical protein
MRSLSLIDSNYSEISNNLLGSAEPNGYMVPSPQRILYDSIDKTH